MNPFDYSKTISDSWAAHGEKWIADRPDHPGEAAKQWFERLFQQNALVRNEWQLDGRRADLGQITMPVLNVYAKNDHIIPPAFVGGKSQTLFAPGVVSFLETHDQAAA